MLTWFQALNPTLQGVVIGSSLSIVGTTIGVVLTNLYNFWSLRKQQAHDRTQKSLERTMSLRRTVYLEAAEALGAGLIMVGNQGNLAATTAELSADYEKRAVTLSKVYLTAAEKTATNLANYMGEFQIELTKLNLSRIKALQLRQIILNARAVADEQHDQAEEIVAMQKRAFLDAKADPEKAAAMSTALRFHSEEAQRIRAVADARVPELQALHVSLVDEAQNATLRLTKKLFPFIVELRQELESPVNSAEFAKMFDFTKPIPVAQLEELIGLKPAQPQAK